MRKIRIDVESIAVESFATDDSPATRGTVRGNAPGGTDADLCGSDYCTIGLPGCGSADCTIECSIDNALTCARRRTEIDSCWNWCECTDRDRRCV